MSFEYELHEENISSLKTGDVFLGSTSPGLLFPEKFQASWFAFIERYILRYKFTHCGCIVARSQKRLLWESSTTCQEDIDTKEAIIGCRLTGINVLGVPQYVTRRGTRG